MCLRAIVLGSCAVMNDAFPTMRTLLFLVVAWMAAGAAARADDPQVIKQFDGYHSLTTSDFTVPGGWEIRWKSEQVLSVGVIRLDNTVIAGATGRNVGSLYLPEGGSYRLRVTGDDSIPWDIVVLAVGTSLSPSTAVDAGDYFTPSEGPAFKPAPPAPAVAVVAPTPVIASAPVAPPEPPPLPTELTAQQLLTIVTIKGDRVQGAGFFLKTSAGPAIITAQQLIANNPNWQVLSSTGATVKVTKIECATDRDVARLSVKDFGYPTLEPGKPEMMHAGDSVLTASATGTSLPSATMTNIGPRRLDVDGLRPVPGSPLVLASSGKVVGVVDLLPQVLASTNFGDNDFDERDSSASGSIEPYGQRFDNVHGWETCDAAKLQVQALFLEGFHQQSRTLDAYLNGTGDERDVKLWKGDDKMKSANETFLQGIVGGDPSQRSDALHQLLFELGVLSDTDMDQVQQPVNFYGFEQLRARDEIAYRQAIKAQLDSYSSDITRFNSIVSRNNN